MRIVRAPEKYDRNTNEIGVFLAGGCLSNEWREQVITELEKYDLPNLVVYDPYNENIKSTYEQILWEYTYLNNFINFIFSAYFDKYTSQPMTMYELGRALTLCEEKCLHLSIDKLMDRKVIPLNNGFPVVLSMHKEAPNKEELKCQCGLLKQTIYERTPKEHAQAIVTEYRGLI